MTRYQISPDIVFQDHRRGRVYNRRSGEQFTVSSATLTLLQQFKNGRAIQSVVEAVSGSKADAKAIREFIQGLIRDGLIQQENARASLDCSLFDRTLATPAITLFSVPARELGDLDNGAIAFLGVPFDLGATGYPGARFAPERLRQYSHAHFDYGERLSDGTFRGWAYDCKQRRLLEGVILRDVGDVIWEVGESFEAVHQRVASTVGSILGKGAFPVVVGGDHSITYGVVKAAASRHGDIGLLHLDAHTDLGDLRDGCCHHHGNYVTRLRSEGLVRFVHQFGVRGNSGTLLEAPDYKVESGKLVRFRSTGKSVKPRCHLSIDIDIDHSSPHLATCSSLKAW